MGRTSGRPQPPTARELKRGLLALKQASRRGDHTIVEIAGQRVAIVPLTHKPRLEQAVEQEAAEEELDRRDIAEIARRLGDPTEDAIPLEQAIREIRAADLHRGDHPVGSAGVGGFAHS